MAKINLMSIEHDDWPGAFYVDQYMSIWYIEEESGMYWESHASYLNETHYKELYKSFIEIAKFEIFFVDFKHVMEQLFQSYRIIKGER